jgi:hypothetical protein
MTYVESLTTCSGPSSVLTASKTAVISMRWLVDRSAAPLAKRPPGTANAQPPGPGFGEHAPSVYTTVIACRGGVERLDELRLELPIPRGDRSASAADGPRVTTERHCRNDDPVVALQVFRDVPPHRAVHHEPVQQNDDPDLTPGVEVVNASCR